MNKLQINILCRRVARLQARDKTVTVNAWIMRREMQLDRKQRQHSGDEDIETQTI